VLQVISVLGALAILGAFSATLFGWIQPSNLWYSIANFLGSAVLTVVAVVDQQLGFLLLEGTWALVSLWGIFSALRGRRVPPGVP
jgi:Flp pilus assembly pilin Flp